jgi:RimJ/RimL family protein N-acetyltransferase
MQAIQAFGPRLHLVQLLPEDIDDAFVKMYLNTGGKNDWFRQSRKGFTREELQRFCEDGITNDNCFYYMVRTNDTDELVGSIRLGVVDRLNSLSDMVTLIGDTAQRGKGFGTEAISLGNRVAFDKHKIRKLHSGVFEANKASITAYLRAGWVIEGRLHNHVLVDGKPMDWVIISCFNPFWVAPADLSLAGAPRTAV